MHSSVGTFEPANCVTTQRPANWSYSTTGSPSPALWHAPPKPFQRLTIETGPSIDAPVALLKTCRPSLTICTYWVAPTSPFVSGGAQLHATPGNGMPSKLRVVPGMFGANCDDCRAASTRSTWCETGRGFGLASISVAGVGAVARTLRSGCETSFLYECPTITDLPASAC